MPRIKSLYKWHSVNAPASDSKPLKYEPVGRRVRAKKTACSVSGALYGSSKRVIKDIAIERKRIGL